MRSPTSSSGDIPDGSTVLTFCYDTGERYFSVEGLFDSDGTDLQIGARV